MQDVKYRAARIAADESIGKLPNHVIPAVQSFSTIVRAPERELFRLELSRLLSGYSWAMTGGLYE